MYYNMSVSKNRVGGTVTCLLYIYIYIYIYMCVCVCVCVCLHTYTYIIYISYILIDIDIDSERARGASCGATPRYGLPGRLLTVTGPQMNITNWI